MNKKTHLCKKDLTLRITIMLPKHNINHNVLHLQIHTHKPDQIKTTACFQKYILEEKKT